VGYQWPASLACAGPDEVLFVVMRNEETLTLS
jgi:hypothetical protein